MEQRTPFHQQLRYERERRGWSQADLAEKVGSDLKSVHRWESGRSLPQPHYRRRFCELFGKNAEELGLVKRANGASKRLFFASAASAQSVYAPAQLSMPSTLPSILHDEQVEMSELLQRTREDWGESPHGGGFFGRDQELARLEQWIAHERCRLIAVLGIGGIGKTALTKKVAEQVKDGFEYVFWRSLHNAPPLEYVLNQCIQFVSAQRRIDLPERIDDQLAVLIQYLQEHRCLLVLDNIESILRSGQRAGHYLPGYENYGLLLRRLGEAQHRSCLLLTSRETPKEVALLEGKTAPVRSLHLAGVEQNAGQEILHGKNLFGSDEHWSKLVAIYSGNPLALKLVSESIQIIFGGDIRRFLLEEEIAFGDINELLEQQFQRLSLQERELLYWLAIEREAVALEDVHANLVHAGLKGELLATLESLHRRFLIEVRGAAHFTLQPVIMEYLTTNLVKQACEEFTTDEPASFAIWMHYALIKAQTKDYVRESQVRLILEPVAQLLLAELGKDGIARKLQQMVEAQRRLSPRQRSYVAGNALNLLNHLHYDLRAADFSGVMIWQAYLQDVSLPAVNFSHTHFASTVFTNIFGNILSVTFSPHKNLLAAGTATGEIWIYETPTGTPLLSLPGHTDGVWSLAISPDERILASSSDDRTVRLWDLTTGECLKIVSEHTNRVRSVAFSPDGRILASACDDHMVRLWDVSSGQCLTVLEGHTDRVWSVAFSHDGRLLASGSNDRTIRLWDSGTGNCLRSMQGHTGWVWSVVFNRKGTLLASGSEDHTVRLWDVSSGQCIKTLNAHTSGVRSIMFHLHGDLLASGSEDHTVRLWDINTGLCLKTLQAHTHGVRSIAFQRDGFLLASGGDDQTIRLWDVVTGYCLKALQGYTRRVWSVAFSPDSQTLVSSCEDQRIRLWDLATGKCSRILQDRTHGARIVIFSPDGSLLASGGEDQTVRLWSTSTGHCLWTLKGHKNWIRSVAFSPEGRLLASGGEDGEVWLWDVSTGQGQIIPQGHTSWVRSVAFSPDGSLLASGSDDQTIRLRDLSTSRTLHILSGHTGRVRSIAFSPDGSLLASGSEDQTVRLWNINTGSVLQILKGHNNRVHSVAFSRDGDLLISSGDDHTIRLWSVSSGHCLKTLRGHTDRIRSLAFAPDGQLFASGSDDGAIKLWDVRSAENVKTLLNEKPYERMNITGASGLTEAQRETLRSLGAIEGQSLSI